MTSSATSRRCTGCSAGPSGWPFPTVAAIQGHAFAAGAMFALAHDFRVMRADRGYFCLPEVDIHIPFTRGMSALIQAKLVGQAAHEAMTTGRRYGGTDAPRRRTWSTPWRTPTTCCRAAIELARPLAGKASPTLGVIKTRMYPAAHWLRWATPRRRWTEVSPTSLDRHRLSIPAGSRSTYGRLDGRAGIDEGTEQRCRSTWC